MCTVREGDKKAIAQYVATPSPHMYRSVVLCSSAAIKARIPSSLMSFPDQT